MKGVHKRPVLEVQSLKGLLQVMKARHKIMVSSKCRRRTEDPKDRDTIPSSIILFLVIVLIAIILAIRLWTIEKIW